MQTDVQLDKADQLPAEQGNRAHAEPAVSPGESDDGTTGPCPNCGVAMHAIRGSKAAVCANCGFKDSCCF